MKALHEDLRYEFAYWIAERENVRDAKESGQPKPWSEDPVFQTTYFCNVDREHDKVTRWIRTHLDLCMEERSAAANLVLARMVNKPDSLRNMEWPFDKFSTYNRGNFLTVMSQPGAWGSAYIVSTNGRAQPKHEYIAGLLEQAFEQLYGPPATVLGGTLASAHAALQRVSGLGSFMAAQVVADLKNTKWHPLYTAMDWYTFSAYGPGSLRGLSHFHGRKVTPAKYPEAIASARQWVQSTYPGLIEGLCNQNLQNCFCEFDKYVRVATGTGRSKRKYNGR